MRLLYAFLSFLSLVNAAQKGPLKFNVIGDWGVGNRFVTPDNKDFKPVHVQAGLTTAQFGHLLGRTEAAVTEAFQTVSDYFHPQFVISTGDQFYDDGLVSRNDTQFKTKFSDVFNHPSVNVTWYPTLGNHDYYINPDNQLNKASDDWRWYFPARNYSFSQYLEDGSEVLFVVMDVNPAILKYRAEKELDPVKGKYKDKQIVQLLQAARASWPGQLLWAEQLLNATNAKWKIVVGHEPIYSSDGENAFAELQESLQPILERTNVSVYFSGHYHTLEITEVNGVNYVISGAAAQIPYPIGNLTAAALTEYFQRNPLNMSLYPTTAAPPTGPVPTYGPTIYPVDPKANPVAKPKIVHFKGGYEAWLPGFMTVELSEKTLNILVWGMGNDTTWSVVKQHDILRKDLQKPNVVAGPLKFNVIGDWGVGNRFIPFDNKDFGDIHKKANLTLQQYGQLLYLTEVSVSNQFQDVSDVFEPDFIISTGDQFYDDGLLTRDDPQFKIKFQDVYTRQSVKVPWYPVLGNHDYYIDPDAQIARTDDPRWVFPARNYSYSWFMEDGTEILFVVMDVNPGLVKYRAEKDLDPVKGKYKDKKIVQLLQAAKVTWPAQLAWAEETLHTSRATWKIVVGHQPVYSSTGSNSFTELQRDLQPILERQNVSVYFAGHYHTLEIVENNGVQYITSGAASQVPYPIGNLTSAALTDYFLKNPVNMSEYPTTVAPTGNPTYGPTIYPAEVTPPDGKPAPIKHFVGGDQLWLPGFMTCTVNLTHMHVEVWGLGNNTFWSIVKRHDVLRKDLRPANLVHKELKFNVIGDWGVGKNFVAPDSKDFKPVHVQAGLNNAQFGHLLGRTETAVVNAFQNISDTFHPHFVLSTGDQFYEDGLISRNDTQFKTKFSDVFNRPSVNVTWYPTLGNHDYYINPDNQLNKYTDDWRWYFPARNYSFSWFIDDGTEVLFVVMDVNPALLKYRAEKELDPVKGKYKDKQIVQLLQAARASWPGQLLWAEQTLNATNAKWKIVMGHEPIYSSDGENAFTELQLSLKPILERTNVSVYFSGHYHTLEITEVNGINYVISGAAAQVPYPIGNLTAAALTEYFQQNPLNMSMDPTMATPTGPTPTYGTTIYPVDPKIASPAKPQIIHSTGGYEAWLPGFLTCSLNATHLNIDTWAMNNDTVWVLWNRHNIIRKDLRQPIITPTNAPGTTKPPTIAPATTQPPNNTTSLSSLSSSSSSSSSSSPRGNSTTTSSPTTPNNTTSSTGVGSSSSSSTGIIPNGAITVTPAFICGWITFITMLFA